MKQELKPILEIQELDMQMIQLMKLKQERQKERKRIHTQHEDLERQVTTKDSEITEIKKTLRILEGELNDIEARKTKLQEQQNLVKKVDEFNALNSEISHAERERTHKEHRLSEMYDALAGEEDCLKELQEKFKAAQEANQVLEKEVEESVARINKEGKVILEQREEQVKNVDDETFQIYERLLKNKKDRVIVPIENRCCSGCHVTITAQDENLVRKGERLVFCEHCSRIHYWPESAELEGTAVATTKTRRRRRAVKS